MIPPQSTVVFEITLPGVHAPLPPDELDEDELELLDEEELELLEDELDEELLELDEEEELLDEEDELPEGTEHSLVPPATLVPAPKVASEHTKLPVSTL